ncbi:MAG: hypothetical protein F6K32_18215 [Desertifilum sp. SIO1I2]|nr:hypothetical protein [Desertifilum sp. SIO1I2]
MHAGGLAVLAIALGVVLLLVFPAPVGSIPLSAANPPVKPIASEQRDVIVWERSGGIAGICHRLTLQSTGRYTLENCFRQQPIRQGQLSRSQFAPLQRDLARYNRFEWELLPPPNSADMFTVRYSFNGKGRRSPTLKDREAINALLAEIASQAMQP